LAVVDGRETIKVFDVATGRLLSLLHCQFGLINSIDFSSDGSILAGVTRSGVITFWDVGSGTLIFSHSGAELAVWVHFVDPHTVAYSSDGRVRFLRAATRSEVAATDW
jgi:WD40 repeat protein